MAQLSPAEKNSKDYLFANAPVGKALSSMILPTILGQMIILIYNMADTWFLGQTADPFKVGGASLILPVFNISISLAGISGVGGSSLVSRLLGINDREEAKKVSSFSFWFAAAITLVFSVSVLIFRDPLLRLLGADENTFSYASEYLFCVMILGGLPTVLSNVVSNLVRCNGYSGEAGFGITLGGLLNIALDPLFMFVILPDGKEVLGAGIATLISNLVSLIYFLAVSYKIRKNSVLTFSFRYIRPKKKTVSEIFSVGIPAAVSTFLFDLDYIVIDKLMVAHGQFQFTAIGIVLKIERLPLNAGVGISQGVMPLVAYNYSSGDHKRMDSFSLRAMLLGLATAAVSITAYEIFAEPISAFFLDNPNTLGYTADFLRIRVIATPLMFLSFYTMHTLQSYGNGKAALFLGIIRWAAFNIPMLFIFDALFGEYGIAFAQAAADLITVIVSGIVIFMCRRRFSPALTP